MMDDFKEGVCKWFASSGQSFGYITYNDGMNEVYVHYSQIARKNLRDPKYRDMKKGDTVKFKIADGYHNNGTQAVEVEILIHVDND